MISFYIFVTSFLIAFLILPMLIKFLCKIRFGDIPGGRKIHNQFTPSMGGIAIIASFFFSFAIWGIMDERINDVWFLLAGLGIVFLVGLSDDIVDLRAYYKLVGQIIAAFIVVNFEQVRVESFYGFLGVDLLPEYFSFIFSMVVLLAASNAFNLIDGIDGLAGMVSSIALLFLGLWFGLNGLDSYALISFGLLGATLSFLFFNWQPAKIFMGDTGALTLGFAIGALVMVFFKSNESVSPEFLGNFSSPFTMGVALMVYPLFDTVRIFVRRIVSGNHPMKADKGHIHHFLLRSGMSHQKVTLVISSVQLTLVVTAILLNSVEDNWALTGLIGLVLIFGGIVEQFTISQIRKRVNSSPKILEKKVQNLIEPKKILEDQSIFSSKMNSN
jgi:UDP-N-acetylmuramyl pentapeptide phosphotransferase/UDP-N-acetylglucosamine-1-phosphate transferase